MPPTILLASTFNVKMNKMPCSVIKYR